MTKEERAVYMKQWRDKNKKKQYIIRKKWRDKNKEKLSAIRKKYYDIECKKINKVKKTKKTPEELKTIRSNWQKNNREKINIYKKQRWKNNPSAREKQNCRHKTILYLKRRGYITGSRECQADGCPEVGVIHHWDYSNCFDISFVCPKHHADIHAGIIPAGIFRHF